MESRHYSNITYRIWGGELFSDDIPDEMFREYENLVLGLRFLGDRIGVKSSFCFTSNLVFHNTQRVKSFLSRTFSVIATSYDPFYRFKNDKQVGLWRDNVRQFNPDSISITLTKQNIHEYTKDPSHLEFLKDYHVNIEYYIYNRKYQFFKPSEDDLYSFFVYCIVNKYYNISEIKAIVESYRQSNGRYCTCNNSCLYLDGKLTFNCLRRSSNLPIFEFFTDIPVEEDYTERQLTTALTRKSCLSCKNYTFCRMYCMASVLHKTYDPKNCALYRVYDRIRENKW